MSCPSFLIPVGVADSEERSGLRRLKMARAPMGNEEKEAEPCAGHY